MNDEAIALAFKLPQNAYWELAAIATYAARLPEIENCWRQVGHAPNREIVAKRIGESLALPEKEVRHLLNGLLNLHGLRDRLDVEPEDLLTSLISAAEEQGTDSWKSQYVDKLKAARQQILDTLRRLGPDHPLSICRKAEELTYQHQNVLERSQIVTDLRPVFSESAEDILEAVITHTLWIEYSDGSHRKRIEIAMDATDLAELHQLCERAQRKAMTLRESLKSMKWPTAIVREQALESEGSR